MFVNGAYHESSINKRPMSSPKFEISTPGHNSRIYSIASLRKQTYFKSFASVCSPKMRKNIKPACSAGRYYGREPVRIYSEQLCPRT